MRGSLQQLFNNLLIDSYGAGDEYGVEHGEPQAIGKLEPRPSREALLDAVVDSEFRQLAEYFGRHNGSRSFETSIIHVMDGYVDYAMAHPRIFDYVFSAPRPGARRFPEDFRARRSPTLNITADAVSAWMKAGKLKRDDPWEIAMELWAHVHGYLALWLGGRFHLSETEFRKLVHRSLRRLLHGLAR